MNVCTAWKQDGALILWERAIFGDSEALIALGISRGLYDNPVKKTLPHNSNFQVIREGKTSRRNSCTGTHWISSCIKRL